MNCEDNEGDNIEVNDVVQDYYLRQAHGDYANCEGVHDLLRRVIIVYLWTWLPAGRQNEDVCAFGHRFGYREFNELPSKHSTGTSSMGFDMSLTMYSMMKVNLRNRITMLLLRVPAKNINPWLSMG